MGWIFHLEAHKNDNKSMKINFDHTGSDTLYVLLLAL